MQSLTPVNNTKTNSSSVSQSQNTFRPKSLNIVNRKRESQQIEEENFKFAKRLFQSHGMISVKDQKNQFKEHKKLKKNV